jgi:hypothetical protein
LKVAIAYLVVRSHSQFQLTSFSINEPPQQVVLRQARADIPPSLELLVVVVG